MCGRVRFPFKCFHQVASRRGCDATHYHRVEKEKEKKVEKEKKNAPDLQCTTAGGGLHAALDVCATHVCRCLLQS